MFRCGRGGPRGTKCSCVPTPLCPHIPGCVAVHIYLRCSATASCRASGRRGCRRASAGTAAPHCGRCRTASGPDPRRRLRYNVALTIGSALRGSNNMIGPTRDNPKLRHFDWSLSRSADSTTNKNDVIYDCPT